MYGTVGGSLLLCFLSGAVFSLPYFFEICFPMTYICLFFLFLLLGREPLRSRQFRGFLCFFLGFQLPLCSWFAKMYPLPSFDLPPLVALLAVGFCCIFVPVKIAVQYAILLQFGRFLPSHPLVRALGYGVLWAVAEWTLQFGVLAFPWGTIAVSQTGCLPVLQTVSLFGTEWLALLVVTVCALCAYAFLYRRRYLLIAGTCALAGSFALGSALLLFYTFASETTVPVAALQGNISTDDKWDQHVTRKIYETYSSMALEAAENGATVILLPETAVPVDFEPEGILHREFGEIAKTYNCTVVMGIFRNEADGKHNSVIAISPDGTLSQVYDKQHPVPFGEYMPYEALLSKLIPSLTSLNPEGALVKEDTEAVIESRDYRMGCFVCFDSAFDGFGQATGNGDFLAVVTNDAWFGDSVALEQHLRHGKLRGVESGRSVIRAANTGLTAVMDCTGQTLYQAEPLEKAILYGELPIYSHRTLFSYIGDSVLLFGTGFLLSAFGYSLHRKMHNKKER